MKERKGIQREEGEWEEKPMPYKVHEENMGRRKGKTVDSFFQLELKKASRLSRGDV